jgi:hypothetical protein
MTVISILLEEGLASLASTCWLSDTTILANNRKDFNSLSSTYHICVTNEWNATLQAWQVISDVLASPKDSGVINISNDEMPPEPPLPNSCNKTRPYLCFSPIFTVFISTHIAFLCCHMIRHYGIASFIVT